MRDRIRAMLPRPQEVQGTPASGIVLPPGPHLRERIDALQSIRKRTRRLAPEGEPISFANLRPWNAVQTPSGVAHEIVERIPGGATHGNTSLHGAMGLPTEALAHLIGEPRLVDFDLTDALFLDIEATGLSHGAGTLAFLIGLGRFEPDGAFSLTQILIDDPDHERAALLRLQEHIDAARYLVSFNGKSYDLSVLQSRMILHRIYSVRETELKLTPHLDLLHIHRGLYRRHLPNCRLQTLEKALLDYVRVDDVPGSLVPSLYFDFLQRGDAASLDPVLVHNRADVLSMAALLAKLLSLITKPEDCRDGEPLVGLAERALQRGLPLLAIRAAERALRLRLSDDGLHRAFKTAVKARKKRGEHDRVHPLLVAWRERFPEDIEVLRQLAMYFEHRARDYGAALAATEQALALLPEWEREERATFARRRLRLMRHQPQARDPSQQAV